MKDAITTVVLGCLCATMGGALLVGLRPVPAEAKSQVKWEYQVGADLRYPLDVAKLNKLGNEGWEAVGATGSLVLMKRQK